VSDTPVIDPQVAAQGRSLEAARWELPAKYRLTASLLELPPEELKEKDPEMYALWQRVQADEKLLREAAASGATMSSQDAFRARAAQRAEEHRVTIANLDKQIAQVAFGGIEGNLDELQAAKIAIRHRMAEQLAILGRFDLAAASEPDPVFRDRYMGLLDAVMRNDSEWCDCGDLHGSGEWSHISVTRQHIAEEVYSLKHARVMPVIRCSGCGGLNVMDAPKHLLQQRAHRARARQIAGHLSKEEATIALTAKGLTTQKLISKK
jgi:hypothetical protein